MENLSKSKSPLTHKIIFPFKIEIDPMERLIVASLKGDPEFSMIEPQVFDDPVNGKGIRVLLYRKDKKVDIYWQPGVLINRDTITIADGIGYFKETIIEPSRFNITDYGVDIDIVFTDAQGRKVELKVIENSKGIKRFPFLAPVGNDIKNPKRLFLANMLEFDFVRKNGTVFLAKIGDRTIHPESFPILRNFKKVLLIRYSALPVIGTLNPPMNKPLIFETKIPGKMEVDGMSINVNKDKKIMQVSAERKNQKIELDFPNGFPNLLEVSEGAKEKGRWFYKISGMLITGGEYILSRSNNNIEIELNVTKNWKPSNLPISFRLFTWLVRSFRNWPSTYKWNGVVNLEVGSLVGAWRRLK